MIRIFRHYISMAYSSLLLIEYIGFFSAMYFGNNVYFLYTEFSHIEKNIILASTFFSSVMVLFFLGFGLYGKDVNSFNYKLLARICLSFTTAFIIDVIAIYYLFPKFHVSLNIFGLRYAIPFSFAMIMITRFLFYKIVNFQSLKRCVLVVGSGIKACKLLSLDKMPIHKGFKIVGCIALPDEISVVDDSEIIFMDRSINMIAEHFKVDEIVIALDDKRQIMPLYDLLDCKMSGFTILDIIGFYEREQGIISLENIYPSWFFYCDGFVQGILRTLEKRFFDLFASILLLSVTWPFMILTAIAIFAESRLNKDKGQIIYRQLRVGENNKNFEVLKFRSMKTDAEKNGAQWAEENDNRITRVGRFIRKYRIDELPQIFNVLKGNMSFVGPRPERPEFVKGFNERIPYYCERHRVKPGITGWAQLCYPYGADESDTKKKLQYDLYYVKNHSLFLDLSIMINTVEVILFGKGAR